MPGRSQTLVLGIFAVTATCILIAFPPGSKHKWPVITNPSPFVPLTKHVNIPSNENVNNSFSRPQTVLSPGTQSLASQSSSSVFSSNSRSNPGLMEGMKAFDWSVDMKGSKIPGVVKLVQVKTMAENRNPDLYFLYGIQFAHAGTYASELVVMNSVGKITKIKSFEGLRIWVAALVNSTTLYGLATASDTDWDWRQTAVFILYNFETGVRIERPLAGGTHWVEFDGHSQTILWLKNKFVYVNCDRFTSKHNPPACPPQLIKAKMRKNSLVSDDILIENLNDGRITFKWDIFQRLVYKKDPRFKFSPMVTRKWVGKSRGNPDYVHANCVFRDPEDQSMYLNSLSLSSVLKINTTTGKLIWVVGEHTATFKQYDLHGNQVDRLFKHAHSVNYLGDGKYVIFDNMGASLNGTEGSRLLMFQVDEAKAEVRTLWTWTPPDEFFHSFIRDNGGGCHPLLDGNIIGVFSSPNVVQNLVEVQDQKVVMHIMVDQAFIQDVSVFYDRPQIQGLMQIKTGVLTFKCMNSFRENRHTPLKVTVADACNRSRSPQHHALEFLPFWQPTPVTIPIPSNRVEVGVINADGIATWVTHDGGACT